jgi:hypothetical protein
LRSVAGDPRTGAVIGAHVGPVPTAFSSGGSRDAGVGHQRRQRACAAAVVEVTWRNRMSYNEHCERGAPRGHNELARDFLDWHLLSAMQTASPTVPLKSPINYGVDKVSLFRRVSTFALTRAWLDDRFDSLGSDRRGVSANPEAPIASITLRRRGIAALASCLRGPRR